MKNKIIEPTNQRQEVNRIIDGSLVSIDIPAIVKQIKNEKPWNESDRNAITVFKTNGLSIVLIALHKNAAMAQNIADGLMSIQVAEGEIIFSTDDESINLKANQMLALHSGILHNILAVQESVFLLTVTTSTKQFID